MYSTERYPFGVINKNPVCLVERKLLQEFIVTLVICFSFQMVWEQGVVVIVNLTKLSDLGLVSTVYNIRKEIENEVSIAGWFFLFLT